MRLYVMSTEGDPLFTLFGEVIPRKGEFIQNDKVKWLVKEVVYNVKDKRIDSEVKIFVD